MAQIPVITIKQGISYRIDFTYEVDGSPYDLDTATITSQIRKDVKSEDIAATFTVVDVDLTTGLFALTLTATETSAIDCGETEESPESQYVWDCIIQEDGETDIRLFDPSIVKISPGCTRII